MNTQQKNTRTAQQIAEEKSAILNKSDFYENYKKYLPIIKQLEHEETRAKRIELLNNKNRHFEQLRAEALLVWNVGEIFEDITTADGTPHKTKAKKYPNLSKIQYCRLVFQDGRITRIKTGREDFRLYQTKHEYNKPTEYTRPETFEHFLILNSIPCKPFTIEEHEATATKLDEATEELKKAIAKYSQVREELNISNLQYWELAEQYDSRTYTYKLK
jgi:hypothetical protein